MREIAFNSQGNLWHFSHIHTQTHLISLFLVIYRFLIFCQKLSRKKWKIICEEKKIRMEAKTEKDEMIHPAGYVQMYCVYACYLVCVQHKITQHKTGAYRCIRIKKKKKCWRGKNCHSLHTFHISYSYHSIAVERRLTFI